MQKFTDSDLYNCSSCGYGTCEQMAIAIHNDLNQTENCHSMHRFNVYTKTNHAGDGGK